MKISEQIQELFFEEDDKIVKLSECSLKEKEAYLSLVCMISNIDNDFGQEEQNYLKDIFSRAQIFDVKLQESIIKNNKNFSNNNAQKYCNVLKNSNIRFSLMADLLFIAFSDEVFKPQEEIFIKLIADYLNISSLEYNMLEQLGNQLLSENNMVVLGWNRA